MRTSSRRCRCARGRLREPTSRLGRDRGQPGAERRRLRPTPTGGRRADVGRSRRRHRRRDQPVRRGGGGGGGGAGGPQGRPPDARRSNELNNLGR